MKVVSRVLLSMAVLGIWMAQQGTAYGQVTNGGFETGDFTGWTTSGTGYVFGTIGTPALVPPEGSFQAGVQTSGAGFGADEPFGTNGTYTSIADLETFFGLASGTLVGIKPAASDEPTFGSAIQQSVTVAAGDILSFRWNFITSEAEGEDVFNDYAFVVIGDTAFRLQAANDDVNGPLLGDDVDLNGFTYRSSGYQTFEFTFDTAGTYTIGVGVTNVGDTDGAASGLLIDNFAAVPEPTSMALLGVGGLVGGAYYFRRWRKAKKADL